VTVECPTCDGDGEIEPQKSGWSTPPGSGEPSADGKRYRLEWHPSSEITKRALFRVITDDRVATLQSVRTIRLQQLGPASDCRLNEEAELEDIPDALLARMRADGFRPADDTGVVA
jgi:hypothetical protein